MADFPGFPSNGFDFHFEEAGAALAGLVMRDRAGNVLPGVFPSTENLLKAGTGWQLSCDPFVAVRSKTRSALIGGTNEPVVASVSPAPAANARLDVAYTLPADVAAGDPITALRIATGVAGAVPAKPSIPAGAIELGTYRSQAGQTNAAQGTITNTFPYAVAAGGVIIARTKAALDQMNVATGTKAVVLAGGREYTRSGNSWIEREAKVLWAGTPIFLHNTQSVNLSEPIADQPTGIILEWQEYTNGQPVNAMYNFSHIPKTQAGLSGGCALPLATFNGTFVRKYVYVDAQAVRGHANNAVAPANGLVLKRVLSY